MAIFQINLQKKNPHKNNNNKKTRCPAHGLGPLAPATHLLSCSLDTQEFRKLYFMVHDKPDTLVLVP